MKGSPTGAVREELAHVRAGKACDRRAELAGLVRGAGSLRVSGGGRIGLEAVTGHPTVARRIFEAVGHALGARAELRMLEPGRQRPRPQYVVRADDVGLQRLVEAGILDEGGAPSGRIPRRVVAKRCCAGAYLRGAFLARGTVSDPRRAPHLEIRADTEEGAEELARLLAAVGAPARTRRHRGAWVAYLKSTGGIGTALAAMGAHDAYLAWEEGSIWKAVHVEVGRLANADAANARRLARAAVAQLAAIDRLDETVGLRSLPAALREIADVRRASPEASLEELGRLCDPPVSKGAVADRLRRIARLAASL